MSLSHISVLLLQPLSKKRVPQELHSIFKEKKVPLKYFLIHKILSKYTLNMVIFSMVSHMVFLTKSGFENVSPAIGVLSLARAPRGFQKAVFMNSVSIHSYYSFVLHSFVPYSFRALFICAVFICAHNSLVHIFNSIECC